MGAGIYIDTIRMNMDLENKDLIGKTVTVSGWGFTNRSPDKSVTDLRIVNQKVVKVTEQYLKASQKGGKGVCDMDSGGKKIQYINSSVL